MSLNTRSILRPLAEGLALLETTCTTGVRSRSLSFTVRFSAAFTTTRNGQQILFSSSACGGDNTTNSHPHGSKEWNKANREAILEEAAALSRSLYRLCFRSARYIQKGNDHDEMEFQEREEKRLDTPRLKQQDVRLGMLSMLPPVDREGELQSRSEYYLQYMRENFVADRDCFGAAYASDNGYSFDHRHVDRFLYHLRKGDTHRKWLLGDMKFEDPFRDCFDTSRVDRFEEKATTFFKELEQLEHRHVNSDTGNELHADADILSDLDDDDDDYSSDDEDSGTRRRSKNRNRR